MSFHFRWSVKKFPSMNTRKKIYWLFLSISPTLLSSFIFLIFVFPHPFLGTSRKKNCCFAYITHIIDERKLRMLYVNIAEPRMWNFSNRQKMKDGKRKHDDYDDERNHNFLNLTFSFFLTKRVLFSLSLSFQHVESIHSLAFWFSRSFRRIIHENLGSRWLRGVNESIVILFSFISLLQAQVG
jgi:hypothetical protein